MSEEIKVNNDNVGEDKTKKKKSIFREYAETIICAFIIAMTIRTFIVEPFKIPTGSMEPTLHGDPKKGDRIFVNKFIYRFKEPKRGDIVVFKTKKIPGLDGKKNYIKRLIGLPGDMLEIIGGAIFVNGERVKMEHIEKNTYYNTTPMIVPLGLKKNRLKIPINYYMVCVPETQEIYILSSMFYTLPDDISLGDKVNFDSIDNERLREIMPSDADFVARSGQKIKFKDDALYVDNAIYSKGYTKDNIYVIQGQYGIMNNEIIIPEDSYYVLGDNSRISKDSRYWGVVPKKNVKGKSMFVWWPPKRWQVTR